MWIEKEMVNMASMLQIMVAQQDFMKKLIGRISDKAKDLGRIK